MIRIRKAAERCHADFGWLDTRYMLPSNAYDDPTQMGFRSLRIINEVRLQPAKGFGMHGHRNNEIITYVLEGALEHRDRTSDDYVLHVGEFQCMSAGTGVQHSDSNLSETEPVHFYEIWLVPAEKGLKPSCGQREFSETDKRGRLLLVASPDDDGSLTIHQDARVYFSSLGIGQQVSHPLQQGRYAWIQVVRGKLQVNGQSLAAGDGAAVSDEKSLVITTKKSAELFLFDLA